MKLAHIPARTGITWFRAGLRTFWRQPMAMAGLFFLFLLLVTVVNFLPWIGSVAALVLLPAMTLGLMAATREADAGKFPMPTILLSAFRAGRERARAMTVLGVIYAAGFLVVLGISTLVDGGQFAHLYLFGGQVTVDMVQASSFQQAMWLVMVLYLPWSMVFWYAPALVHWHGVSPGKSLFFSAVACVRHFGALTLYTLAWLGLGIGLGTLLLLLGLLLGDSVVTILMFPLAMMLAAMFFCSVWFTFRDSFVADDEPALASAATLS
jgi:hypothetical protein